MPTTPLNVVEASASTALRGMEINTLGNILGTTLGDNLGERFKPLCQEKLPSLSFTAGDATATFNFTVKGYSLDYCDADRSILGRAFVIYETDGTNGTKAYVGVLGVSEIGSSCS